MSAPNSIPAFRRWLTVEIKGLDVEYEPDEQQFYEAAATIREARRIAINLDRPDVAEVCRKVRTPALAFTTAQSVLAECRSMLKADRPRDIFTPPQVAKQLSVSPDTVRAWIDSGKLTAENLSKPGKRPRYRVSKEALAEFQKSRRVVKQALEPVRRRAPSAVLFKRY